MRDLRLPTSARIAAAAGEWLRHNGTIIRTVQWCMVVIYAALLIAPAMLPPAPAQARILDHLAVAAQFVFWGIWWPFVIVSVALVGRAWCGLLCPEGTLTEWASRHGRHKAIPRWLRWPGWPPLAFAATTIYGQMISVYQYPRATLLLLGGSTLAAMMVGYLYGREKRVWCRYLCPVSGVFRLLAKLAPLHFRVDAEAWSAARLKPCRQRLPAPNCAPLLSIRTMTGAADCHMCGRCSGYNGAVTLGVRGASQEILRDGHSESAWSSALLLYGAIGLAMGAFHWTASPWFVALKQAVAAWLVARGESWPLAATAPWWLLTNQPLQNDVFTLLDGAALLFHIAATSAVMGTALLACMSLASATLGTRRAFHHLAQALAPLAGAGLFLGLSTMTVGALRFEGVTLAWLPELRATLLGGAASWSLWLAWRVAGKYGKGVRRTVATACALAGIGLVSAGWVLLFWIW